MCALMTRGRRPSPHTRPSAVWNLCAADAQPDCRPPCPLRPHMSTRCLRMPLSSVLPHCAVARVAHIGERRARYIKCERPLADEPSRSSSRRPALEPVTIVAETSAPLLCIRLVAGPPHLVRRGRGRHPDIGDPYNEAGRQWRNFLAPKPCVSTSRAPPRARVRDVAVRPHRATTRARSFETCDEASHTPCEETF